MIFIQHLLFSFNILLICKIHKFRIPSLWTINFFFTNMFIHIRDIYSITFNGKICYSIHSTFCAHLSLRIIWSQAPVSGLDLLETGDPPCWFGEHHKASFSLSKLNFQWWSRNRLRVVPHFSSGIYSRASETQARVKIRPREKRRHTAGRGKNCLSPPRVTFSRMGDFHSRSRFARFTIPEEKWGNTRSLEHKVFWNGHDKMGLTVLRDCCCVAIAFLFQPS